MAALLGAWTAIKTWPWPIVSAVLSATVVLLIVHTQIIRPRNRRRKLKQPFDAYFLITSLARFPLTYALQDDKEHFVKELVVPPNTEVPIQIVLEPKVSFMQHELSFGCDESLADENKPSATEYFVPFVVKGLRGSGKPDKDHPGHYIDYNGFYHVRENYLYTKDTRVIGFRLQTKAAGIYTAQIYTTTDDVRGRADLTIRVEQPARTKMRCHMKAHQGRGCFVTPTGVG